MNNIKVLRERNGLSQKVLAEKLKISQQAVARWEGGQALPQASLLPKIADIMGCTIDELFGRKNASA